VTPENGWKRMWIVNFAFLAAIAIALVVLVLFGHLDGAFVATFVLLTGASGFLMYRRQKSNPQSRPDERIRRLTYRSMGFSWQATVFGALALYLLNFYHLLSLTAAQALGVVLAFMYLSFLLIMLFLRLRGDVAE
jgi:hypothetical protein